MGELRKSHVRLFFCANKTAEWTEAQVRQEVHDVKRPERIMALPKSQEKLKIDVTNLAGAELFF